MATVAVVTSSPPFAEGGHLVMARELVRALREEGHQSGLIVTPQNRFGQQGSAYLAAWCTDVELAHEEKKVDQVISLRFPGYAVQHPNHVLWLNHRMREYYDLWDQFSSHLTWKQGIKERARRALIHRVDAHLFRRMRKRYVISATVQARLQNLVWGKTGNRVVRLQSRLNVAHYVQQQCGHAVLMLCTLGLYWPWAQLATHRMRLQAVTVWSRVDAEELRAHWPARP